MVILLSVFGFVVKSPSTTVSNQQNAIAEAQTETASNPLDQLSSADIAVHIARMTRLDEAVAVVNNADSLDSKLTIAVSENAILSKPQVVATTLKSDKDIEKYVTVAGDTIASLAAKFGVTSDTIRWSNSINGDTLPAGKEIYVLPGVNGIIYVTKSGDTVESLATKYRTSSDQIVAYNDTEINGLMVGRRIMIPDGTLQPVSRYVTYGSGFAWGASALYGYNGYDYGYCTWYVANRRTAIGRPVPANLGNAYSWYRVALGAGMPTGLTPRVGAVAVNQGGNHVSVVEAVNEDGSFWISEMNSSGQVSMTDPTPTGGWGRLDYKLITSPGSLKFIY